MKKHGGENCDCLTLPDLLGRAADHSVMLKCHGRVPPPQHISTSKEEQAQFLCQTEQQEEKMFPDLHELSHTSLCEQHSPDLHLLSLSVLLDGRVDFSQYLF